MAKKERQRKSRRSTEGRSSRRTKGRRGASSTGFKYKARDAKKWKERSEQSGFSRRSMFAEGVTLYRTKDGDNCLRILPPTFEDADHYGYEIFVHYGIGPDNDSFLDLEKMLKADVDPINEERMEALNDGDKDYADKLTSRKRVLCYVIDRDDEEAGLQLWSCPWTVDADITTLAVDKRTGEVLDIDDPDNGYDVEFTRTGKGVNTKYVGVAIARKSSALDNDKALEDAVERPLPETLKFYSYEEIKKVFEAGGSYDKDDDDDDDKKGRSDKGKGKKGKGKKKDAEPVEITWGEVMAMDFDELLDLIEDENLDIEIDGVDSDDDDEIQDLKSEACDELGLKKPKKRKATKDEKKKLRKRGKK